MDSERKEPMLLHSDELNRFRNRREISKFRRYLPQVK